MVTVETKLDTMAKDRYIFTFGHGQPNFPGYVVVYGRDADNCREKMMALYGRRWSMQYRTEEEAGVSQFNLQLIATLGYP